MARSIQQASLPEEVPSLEGWQIAPYYQPAREVGGDFYDFFELEDSRMGLAVGDATGKGMPAALAVTASCSMLRAVAQDSGYSPGEVMARVNKTLLARIPSNMFVTCFYAILEPESGTLTYANAGHDLPYLWHGGAAEELRARGMPLGLMPGMDYEEKEIVLKKGDSALLYTDGLVEAHDPQREMFGFARLQALVSEHGEEEERSLEEALLEELYSFVELRHREVCRNREIGSSTSQNSPSTRLGEYGLISALSGNLALNQRGASAALVTRSSLRQRTTVQVIHTATTTHWNKPIHGCSSAPGSSASAPNANIRTTIAMPLPSV